MGLLKVGTPKSWDKSKQDLSYIRKAGVRQFLSTYNRVKDLKGDELLWGDEIEYGIFKLDSHQKKVRLSLRAKQVMDELNDREALHSQVVEGCNWVPEYGAWMVEATPDRPYTGYTTDLLRVERNMRLRRKRLLTALDEDEVAPTISAYFLLGAQGEDGSVPPTKIGGPQTMSEYIGDDIINPHPRFGTLTANIRQRRGDKVNIRVPLFRDTNTPEYAEFETLSLGADGCCGSDSQQLWRYGKGDASMEKYGKDHVVVGCSNSPSDVQDESAVEEGTTLQKWLVDVKCEGCRGLFYRRAPGQIVADADWPRNGDIVLGYELPNEPGWIRLQNGYYLPMSSDDGEIPFLHKVSSRTEATNSEMRRIGSNTPLFRLDNGQTADDDIATLGDAVVKETGRDADIEKSSRFEDNVRACIHMDAMAFGMGNCCLQITFQAKDVDESRFMYDQLAVMAPIMMALTASTPILKGRLADTDARWGVISESVDDRTLAERGRDDPAKPHKFLNTNGTRRIYKPRYDSVSTYIYQGAAQAGSDSVTDRVLNIYSDIPVPVDEDTYHLLRKAGIDPALSQHISHLFIRDPLVVFEGAVSEVDDNTQTEHFESIQSTNWQTVRWKPPPPRNTPNDPHIGWRTEFRSMEMQLTDFENAAFTVFTVLLTRVIIAFDLNLYIPISRVDMNMERAHSRNSAAKGKFFFRRHLAPLEEGDDGYGVKYASMFSSALNGHGDDEVEVSDSVMDKPKNGHAQGDQTSGVSNHRKRAPCAPGSSEENAYEEMTMSEIMIGKGDYFPGLIPLINAYLDHIGCDKVTGKQIGAYLEFIERRARGDLMTPATWIREFVRNHKAYQHDSVVNDEIAYDLTVACQDIGLGKLHVPELIGDNVIRPITKEGAYDVKLDSQPVQNDRIVALLKRYASRTSFSGVGLDQ